MGYWKGFLFQFDSLFITGVDIQPQKNYPFHFVQADAIEYLKRAVEGDTFDGMFVGHGWDFIHASPPCQQYSVTRSIHRKEYPDYISELRGLLKQTKVPYVIENVVGAPLENPIQLCGGMFGLKAYRHRLFETSFPVAQPKHPRHVVRAAAMGRGPKDSEFMTVVGHFSGVERAKVAMDIDWMVRDELAQAIPPAYTEYIAQQYLIV